MKLQHRFEVPVGIDMAWSHLLDMEKVAACFPGAALSTSDGDEYVGTVKVKMGPIQLTYAGAARIIAADETAHTATIEASGNAARSGSTAALKVVASASAVGEDRTLVEMLTDLTITGRPAQFGRGVMVEVGDKILSRFADCLSRKLAATEGDSSGIERGAGTSPSEDARFVAPSAANTARQNRSSSGSATASNDVRGSEPINLLGSARESIVKRLVPIAAGLLALFVWHQLRRGHSRCSID